MLVSVFLSRSIGLSFCDLRIVVMMNLTDWKVYGMRKSEFNYVFWVSSDIWTKSSLT